MAIENGEEITYVNKSLILISKGKYDEAIKNILEIKDVGIFDWWMNMDDSENEKYIVLLIWISYWKNNV